MKLRGNTSGAAWVNLSGFSRELLKEIRIEVMHFIKRHVETAAWHFAVGAAKVHRTLFGFRSNHRIVWLRLPRRLALLTMESTSLQVWVKLNFLKSARRAETLLVSGGNIDRRTGAFFFGFRAFKDNDFSGHDWARLRVFARAANVIGKRKFSTEYFNRRLRPVLPLLFRRVRRVK